MFALGLVCWLFNRDLAVAENFLREKFAKKPQIAEANIKVIHAGYDYGHNTHASVDHTYKVETKSKVPGKYMDISGNKATAYGLIAAAEKAGLRLFLGSYPITPATDILHELSKHKSLGVTTVQCEDEISGCATAIGASFAGALAATSTSGPGVCLKSEAMNLAVITELPLVCLLSLSKQIYCRLCLAVTVNLLCRSLPQLLQLIVLMLLMMLVRLPWNT